MVQFLHFSSVYTILGYVLPRIVACVESGEDFLTYVPGKDTLMPDGSIICLQEPTDKCPNCSGLSCLSINTDLFPHLTSYIMLNFFNNYVNNIIIIYSCFI
jgi:hypothetical protein